MNPMKDVGGVAKTKSWLAKFKSAWVITPSEIVESKFYNHMHIFISQEESQVNPMKNVGGVADR